MSRVVSDKCVNINASKIRGKIDSCGITMGNLSTMVLNCEGSYVSKSLNVGRFNIDKLTKLCEFLNLNVDDVIVQTVEEKKPEKPVEVKSDASISPQLETMIVGLNTIYETQRKMCELLEQVLTEIKCTNAKQNRLENALGQIVQNTIILKENTSKIVDTQNHLSSQANIVSGRTRDIVQAFQKVGNHNAK